MMTSNALCQNRTQVAREPPNPDQRDRARLRRPSVTPLHLPSMSSLRMQAPLVGVGSPYAERMRPAKFKAGAFDVGYNSATVEPSGVGIGYRIGAKQLAGNSFVDLATT